MISSLPDHEREHQWGFHNVCSYRLGQEDIVQIFELITELLTAFIGRNRKHNRQTTDSINKKHFRPGRMAKSEWTRSVGAVRDTPVADHSAPGINTRRHMAYCPLIAISPFLLTLWVSYFEQALWRCGQLWPYVGMGSLGTRLHRDCNAIGDAAKISPHIPSTLSSRSVARWEDMILPSRED